MVTLASRVRRREPFRVPAMSKRMAEFKTPISKKTKSVMPNTQETPNKLVIPPSPCMKQLGYGTGVTVYLMERFSPIHDCYSSPWAVKKLNRKIKDRTGEYTKRLSFEADILKNLNHKNIIGYRSYQHNKDGSQCLAMESGEKSLADLIEAWQEADLGPFSPQKILKVARDISSALTYLHEEKHLLHGDLKSSNILIKGNFEVAKLCDFGVTLKLNEYGVACDEDQEYVGTECWSAPEALIGETVTHKSDMFSFGLILWEMLSLRPPHIDKLEVNDTIPDDVRQSDLDDSDVSEFQNVLGTRPCLPNVVLDDDYLHVLEIFYACTEAEPHKRPSAKQIMHILHCFEEDIKDKIENKETGHGKLGDKDTDEPTEVNGKIIEDK
ncbi:lymphokine-activated killer T-cell-originated protein kinase-like isoform X2 [Homarus americanus]|uniref:lymphokine-activated killer T-cell-originated protein kinase-like isoform X2 n=1 Tax=Homarus americanus TaxID=6706 RepID=UPI001C481E9F|nr:lymphokine-activated killer T-cell-originated protein kinase-like isoform X2 [Homarus americanus]